jgi:hypothetical protein
MLVKIKIIIIIIIIIEFLDRRYFIIFFVSVHGAYSGTS